MAEEVAFSRVYKCIHAAYSTTFNLIDKWNSCINSNYDLVKSFLTYLDQLKDIKSVDDTNCAFGSRSRDIKEQIVNKIYARLNEEYNQVNEAVSTLEKIVKKMLTELHQCENEWKNNFHSFDTEKFSMQNHGYPAVSEMLLWLEEIYYYYDNGCVLRKLLLESWQINNKTSQLLNEWPVKSTPNEIAIILRKMKSFANLNLQEV